MESQFNLDRNWDQTTEHFSFYFNYVFYSWIPKKINKLYLHLSSFQISLPTKSFNILSGPVVKFLHINVWKRRDKTLQQKIPQFEGGEMGGRSCLRKTKYIQSKCLQVAAVITMGVELPHDDVPWLAAWSSGASKGICGLVEAWVQIWPLTLKFQKPHVVISPYKVDQASRNGLLPTKLP